jgi:hypothetical protein
MTLPTAPIAQLTTVGPEDGSRGAPAVLEVPVYLNRYCEVCQETELFVAELVCASGLISVCIRCGSQRSEAVIPFTRTNSEEA